MEPEEAPTESATRKLRRRPWQERAAFVAVVAVGLGYYYLATRGGGPCLITLDGRPVVVVRSRAIADRVLGEIKQDSGGLRGVSFLQQVALRQVSPDGRHIVSDAEALRLLLPRLTRVVHGAGVFANGRLVFGLPNRQEAVQALSRLLTELSPQDPDLIRALRERVKVSDTQIPIGSFLPSADRVMDRVREMTAPRGTHAVQRGETAWKIARAYHVSLDALAYANPGADLKRLHEADQIAIPGADPPLNVIAWKETDETVAPGKTRTVRVTYLNGHETERVVVRRSPRKESSRPAAHRRRPRRASSPETGQLKPRRIRPPEQETNRPSQDDTGGIMTTPQESAETR